MTEHIFTGILESYRKDEISIKKAKRSIRLLLDDDNTSNEVVKKFNISSVLKPLKEKYTQNFLDYKERFFKYRPKTYEYVSKDGKREYTIKGLCKYYEKAMNESPLMF
jgi:hypothetical protein